MSPLGPTGYHVVELLKTPEEISSTTLMVRRQAINRRF